MSEDSVLNIKKFISTLDTPNTIKVVSSVLDSCADKEIETYNPVQFEQLILDLKPSSPKAIITICYVLGLYAKWLENQNIVSDDTMYQIIQSLDRNLLWTLAKPNAKKKFISHNQFESIVDDIGKYEEYNALYYQTLFRCLYEGIYNDDMSVIKNLRGSDIKENIVVLHEDNGHSYKLEISYKLAEDLKELTMIEVWERKNRYGVCRISMKGRYPDSCFKVENRSTLENSETTSFRFSYYAKLRKISKEYLEYNLLPLQLYTSGIMYRIRVKLEEQGITLEDAFSEYNRNKTVGNIISNELKRCNNNIENRNFRELVKGHLDVFSE